ncbi:MAG TPA: tetratricopeptide repeat protein [Blastocatellia bacterium]|nr:tetratricopeptide repeat protein [Blastocatellia bacterium]
MTTMRISRRLLSSITATLLAVLCSAPALAAQQSGDQAQSDKQRAIQLINDAKAQEALPILEKLAKDNPNDSQVQFYLGYAKVWSAKLAPDAAARKKMRAEGYACFKKARELGMDTPLLKKVLADMPEDGGADPVYSANKASNDAMIEAEAEFARGNLEKALAAYQKALAIEPTLYEAALFAGDACFKSGDQTRALEFYAKAMAIDPSRETAYRYMGDALMSAGKTTEARDKYIEGYISEPYTRLSTVGLVSWAKKTGVGLSHPKIEIPTSVTAGDKDEVNVNLDEKMLNSKGDGSSAWMLYGLTRAHWRMREFAEKYPAEKTYRHSLAEEVDALNKALDSVSVQTKEKTIKSLSPSLATLIKLKEAGLVEPYVLLARPDSGIAADYPAYLKANRDKLRRYVLEFVIHQPN